MNTFALRFQTSEEWTKNILNNLDTFLEDHAAAEKKAAGMAISMASHYPDKPALVEAMADLAVEEMTHYREVVKIIHRRGGRTSADTKDDYVGEFRKHFRKGRDVFFLDRLLVGGIIEARGAERFGLVAEALEEGPLKTFYKSITRSEERHLDLFVGLAQQYFSDAEVDERLDQLLDIEAKITASLPIKAQLH